MWTEALTLVAGLALGYGLHVVVRRARRAGSQDPDRVSLYEIASDLQGFYEQTAHPSDLLPNTGFREGVALLSKKEFPTDALLAYARGDNQVILCMALEALRARAAPDNLHALLSGANVISNWARFFLFRVLREIETPVVAALLRSIDYTWQEAMASSLLGEYVIARLESGEAVPAAELAGIEQEKKAWLCGWLRSLNHDQASRLADALEQDAAPLDTALLRSVGRIVGDPSGDGVIEHTALLERVDAAAAALTGTRPRPVVLVGPHGAGKTAVVRTLSERLAQQGWTIFEAGASQMIADQIYIGQLEGRVRELLKSLRFDNRVAWLVPDLQLFAVAGRGEHHRIGLLDLLMPALMAREVPMVAEVEPQAWERVLRSRPELRAAVETIPVPPLDEDVTRALAATWAKRAAPSADAPLVDPATIVEAHRLAQQLLGETAPPGDLLRLLHLTLDDRRAASGEPPARLTLDDVLGTLSKLTGLPRSILDDREHLELEALERFFAGRVLGQHEAVQCLVERVALIKAGLTDPGRPQGVFLFTGPTGTGKTEIARTLAEFLFGSPERLVRLDMSEFQEPGTHSLIVGDAWEGSDTRALVDRIREQPFAVVLLDEIEKAHPSVWDLFLQVFDAGRLTDRRGRTADFRHAIFILTSNLGGESLARPALGFQPTDQNAVVQQALRQSFRPEFLNRLDRVVVFRPLSRSTMRDILVHELDRILELRGLRNRSWAVEWDESAIDFLLERGFSEDLGARPLRRVVERYLLAPLATTIVNREAPAGDQFLLVRSEGNGIDVVFIDPDAPGESEPAAVATPAAGAGWSLGRLALDGSGVPGEVAFLAGEHESLLRELDGDRWREQKQQALDATADPDFWNDPERFAVLGRFEYMERIENGMQGARRLLDRLRRNGDGPSRANPELVRRLAQQLYLVRTATDAVTAGRPGDAFLSVEALPDPRHDVAPVDRFAAKLGDMYREWARKRRMRFEVLEEREATAEQPYRLVAAVAGYGAYAILEGESGLHVLDDGERGARCRARVTVVPQPAGPAGRSGAAGQANAAFAAQPAVEPRIVRSYRERPSPLVKDRVRGWRTGRLDRVLAGDFDLVG